MLTAMSTYFSVGFSSAKERAFWNFQVSLFCVEENIYNIILLHIADNIYNIHYLNIKFML